MKLLLLDYAHGRAASGKASGEALLPDGGDGDPLDEDDFLLRVGTVLERRLEAQLQIHRGRNLVLTRPDANRVDAHARLLAVNRHVADPRARLLSVHAHRVAPPSGGSRVRIYRPASGPAPDPMSATSPAEAGVLEYWADVAALEGFRTHVAVSSVTFARHLCHGLDRHRAPTTSASLFEWLKGRHVQGEARALFAASLVPCAVAEIALGTTEAEVRRAVADAAGIAADLFGRLESAVGWGP